MPAFDPPGLWAGTLPGARVPPGRGQRAMTGRTLTIESGLRCNNRCVHCNQPMLRAGGILLEPETADLRARIASGRDEGFDGVAFSGGEPTLRRDLPDLIAWARQAGYQRIGITTNGRMLSYRGFSERLVEAGLTGASVSLHGPSAEIHDAVTGIPGSFDQAVRGIARLHRAFGAARVRPDLSTITVLTPFTLPVLRETLCLAGSLGVTLHVVQPFILARENLGDAPRFLLSLDTIVAGIERALAGGLPHGGRIKAFNLPPCRLDHLGKQVELQEYETSTFKEFRDSVRGKTASGSTQFVRIEACAECTRPCPGMRLEHLPQAVLARAILEDIEAWGVVAGNDDVTLSCLDLLQPDALAAVLAGARRSSPRRLRVMWGGQALTSAERFVESCRASGIDEVCLLLSPPALRLPDRHVRMPGNLADIRRDLVGFRADSLPVPSLFLMARALLSDVHGLTSEGLDEILVALKEAGGNVLNLAVTDIEDPRAPPPDDSTLERVASGLLGLAAHWRSMGITPRLVRVPDPTVGGRLESILSGRIEREDWSPGLIQHRFAGPGFSWVAWSNPTWLFPGAAAVV